MCVLFCCLVILSSGRVVYAVPRIHACCPSPELCFQSRMSVHRLYTVLSRATAWTPAEFSFSLILLCGSVQVCRTAPYLFSLFYFLKRRSHLRRLAAKKKKAAWQCVEYQKPLWGRISQQRITWRAIDRVGIVTARLAQRQTGGLECVARQSLPQVWTELQTMTVSVNWRCLLSGLVVFFLPHLLRTRRLPILRVTNIHIYVYVYIYCILRQYISITYDKLSLLSSVRSATGVLLSGVAPSEPIWSACNHKTFFSAPTRRPERDI